MNKGSSYDNKILGQKIKINKAPEPSDIIWEKRHINKTERRRRGFIVFGILLFLLFLSSKIILVFSRAQIKYLYTYPPKTVSDC